MSRARTRGRGRRRGGRRRSAPSLLTRLVGSVALVAAGVTAGMVFAAGEVAEADTATDPGPVWREGRVRVEVLNGGGVSGMAAAATEALRERGFDVVHFGNASSFDPARPSVVIDRVGRTDIAGAVAQSLGIDNVHSEPDPNLYVDVTVVVGQAWALPQGGDPEGAVDTRPPWDPRRWFER